MKKIFLFFFSFIAFHFAFAQNGDLMIRKADKGLYLDYKVAPKESFYSIGRLFNVHPAHIASFNSLNMNKGLVIGQLLKIPLTDSNFSQKTAKGRPVFYKVGNNEGLYRVTQNNGKVLMADLRKWNHLTSDKIQTGDKLIVGYLVSGEAGKIAAVKEEEPVTKEPLKEVVKEEPKKETDDRLKAPNAQEMGPVKIDQGKTDESKAEPVKNDVVKDETSAKPAVVKEDVKPAVGETSFFKPYFEQQIKTNPVSTEITVTAGIFKTTSGWQDAKYYLLMDKVEPGTIVKLTNPTNNKSVFAKVLGQMSGIKQNEGLNIRISNAAAAIMEITDTDKFILKADY